MDKGAQVLVKMDNLLADWEAANDKRVIFLSCYKLMTENVLAAIQSEVFEDTLWVATLMENFAGYYFQALENFEKRAKQSTPGMADCLPRRPKPPHPCLAEPGAGSKCAHQLRSGLRSVRAACQRMDTAFPRGAPFPLHRPLPHQRNYPQHLQ